MATSNIYELVDTWNNGATTFFGIKMNVTNTASDSNSRVIDIQANGTSHFSVDVNGLVRNTYCWGIEFVKANIMYLDNANNVLLQASTVGIMKVSDPLANAGSGLDLQSFGASPPSAPAAGRGLIYLDTSGGKVRLMARFPTGAAQQVAIEP